MISCITGLCFFSCEESVQPDLQPPELEITYPYDQSVVSGIVTIVCSVTDNKKIEFAELWVDEEQIGDKIYTEPYFFLWDTRGYDNYSNHLIKVRVYDTFYNFSEQSIQLTVFN